jgi:cyclopropane fatty-acyl-phospholipid synthase-like methyltransferase
MATIPNAPAAERNKNPILEVIRDEFQDCKSILEIGSGTGQHAVFFASQMPWLSWQTSDLSENHDGINARLKDANLDNVIVPLALDVKEPLPTNEKFDAVYSANTAHIMGIAEVECMFGIVGQCLVDGGKFCLYGPFNQNGNFTSDSNQAFDANLKLQNPAMGIRDLEVLDGFADANGLHRTNLYAMPANNMIAVWIKN